MIVNTARVRAWLPGIALLLGACLWGACGGEGEKKSGNELPEFGMITADNISLRTDPVATSAEITSMERGTRVKLKKRTRHKVSISGYENYWYLVRLENGVEGWVFGAKLNLTGELSAAEEEQLGEDMKKRLVGKWWETSPSGATGYRKLYFWLDGKYRLRHGQTFVTEGKFEILPHKKLIVLDKGGGVGVAGELSIKQIGHDLRLYSELDGNTYMFRLGDRDPEGKEEGLDEEVKKK